METPEYRRCPWKASHRVETEQERGRVQVGRAGGKDYPRQLSPDPRHVAAGLSICPPGFWSCSGPILLCLVPVPPIWNNKIYSVPLYIKACNLFTVFFFFTGFFRGSKLRLTLSHRRDFELLSNVGTGRCYGDFARYVFY